MTFGDTNLFTIVFILLLSSIVANVTSALHLLLTAELLWVTLYLLVLSLGTVYDNNNILSLTFFYLVLSAVEFGFGLVLILSNSVFLRSTLLTNSASNILKGGLRFSQKLKNSSKFFF